MAIYLHTSTIKVAYNIKYKISKKIDISINICRPLPWQWPTHIVTNNLGINEPLVFRYTKNLHIVGLELLYSYLVVVIFVY